LGLDSLTRVCIESLQAEDKESSAAQ